MDVKNLLVLLSTAEGFDWDDGNAQKNRRHGVEQFEIEQVFFNPPSVVLPDEHHSSREARWRMFGRTLGGRRLMIVFTVRGRLIRPISARPMNRREKNFYEEETKKNPPV